MKHFKFSRLFAVALFTATLALAFAGCKQPDDATVPDGIVGTWVSPYDEKYVISETDYDNYYKDTLYYSTNNLEFAEIDSTSGYIYGQFDDEEYVGYGAKKGQWYALYYSDLTGTSVKFYQPYKEGGKPACDTLDEAKEEFTVANGYFPATGYSECVKR